MRGAFKPCKPDAVHAQAVGAELLDAHAHRLERLHRAQAVLAVEKAADLGGAFGQRAPSMTARCEIDLSPGTRTSPGSVPPGCTRS